MASIIWQGAVEGSTFRVIDLGSSALPRLEVEVQQLPDKMGARGWGRYEPIPTTVFSAMLVAAGIVH